MAIPDAILGTRKLGPVSEQPQPTRIAGQESAPMTTVPHTPGLQGASIVGQTNSLAVVSLVSGALSFFAHVIPLIGGFTVAIIAIITGFMARSQIQRTGEQGTWMANVGIVLGFVHLALGFVIAMIIIFVVFVLGIALFGIAAGGGGGAPSPVPSG
jgi:Domain of unknown function (DUF4190)